MEFSPNDAAVQHNRARQKPGLEAWILTDGRAGNLAPPKGLAATLGLRAREWDVTPQRPYLWAPPAFWPPGLLGVSREIDQKIAEELHSGPPAVLMSCGRRSVAAALELKRRTGALAVHIQNPRVDARRFDLVVAPAHDRLTGPNVEVTLGSLHGLTDAKLAEARTTWEAAFSQHPSPRIAVSIGGSNKAYCLDAATGVEIGRDLRALVDETGAGLMVTGSRRTDPAAWRAITDALAGTDAYCWDGSGANPYFGFLAWADQVIVTGDSVNMVSEAAATGKPVHVIPLPIVGKAQKFERFHAAFRDAGISREFKGRLETWDHTPPDDTARVAARVTALLAERGLRL